MLAGSADGSQPVCVDDELYVYVNSSEVYEHTGAASCLGLISLGAVATGDRIEAVAKNSPAHCGYISLSPLYLICEDTGGVVQTLDSSGVARCWGSGFPCDQEPAFYDTTFTVQI